MSMRFQNGTRRSFHFGPRKSDWHWKSRAGLFDYVGWFGHSRFRGSTIGFSKLYPPALRFLCLRFACSLTVPDAKLEARMVRYSFSVGLFHPLPYAGLSRRTAWHRFSTG